MNRIGRTTLLAAAAALLFGVGCGKATEKLAEKATEKVAEAQCEGSQTDCEVDIDADSGEVKIKTDEGEVVVGGEDGELPEGWPDDIPVPDGYAIVGSSSTETGEGTVMIVTGTVDMSAEEVIQFFEDELSGWEDATPDGFAGGTFFEDGDRSFMASVSESGGETALNLNYTAR